VHLSSLVKKGVRLKKNGIWTLYDQTIEFSDEIIYLGVNIKSTRGIEEM
jgi:hypothetical protein